MKVVTRFAPSPTGYLHLGGARTALFNYLFAKKHNGTFLIRIEDTDQKRSTKEAVQAIYDGLKWLNLNSTEEIVYQSEQKLKHIEVANQLLKQGFAYKCFLNQDEIEELRVNSRKTGVPIKSPWRNKTSKNDIHDEHVIRLKMPLEGNTTIKDKIQGEVTVENTILDDMIILRSDKNPTYMLSSVVDDFNMGVTHVIRGDDHFNNTFRQVQIINYLGWDKPVYAHIPLIHGTDGTKLSKRHGATNVYEFNKMGYINEAMCSYLLQLGWSTEDEKNYNIKSASKLFSLEKINNSPAKFDIKKLNNINSSCLNSMDLNELLLLIKSNIQINFSEDAELRLKNILPELLKRVNVFTEIFDDIEWIVNEDFFCKNNEFYDMLIKNKYILSDISKILNKCLWSKEEIETSLKNYFIKNEIKFKDIGPSLRIALTGKTNSPDIASVIFALGCATSFKRLNYKY